MPASNTSAFEAPITPENGNGSGHFGGRASSSDVLDDIKGFASKHSSRIEDTSILLVDDVVTSGATLDACAEALKEHGALQVFRCTVTRSEGAAAMFDFLASVRRSKHESFSMHHCDCYAKIGSA
ncbi:MAG: Phosphoribosyl transferase domain [Chthoniobacter sp.]|jgi:hypothetical protein|nr:Phosphoribosyl transferase domain [Chthoniobacter sp.]